MVIENERVKRIQIILKSFDLPFVNILDLINHLISYNQNIKSFKMRVLSLFNNLIENQHLLNVFHDSC